MTTITRIQYAVRCRSKFDPTLWVDMWVLAAVCVATPNAVPLMYAVGADSAYVVDNTGGGNSTGSPNDASRTSHMERFTSATDPSQILDLEFLDGFIALQPDFAGQGGATNTHPVSNYQDDQGDVDSGRDGIGVNHGYFFPEAGATPYIIDSFGLGLGQGYQKSSTRVCHVNIVTSDGNTDDQNAKLNHIPPVGVPWLASIKTDYVSVTGPNNTNFLLAWPMSKFTPGGNINDITKYTTDVYDPAAQPPDNKTAPPDNGDQNVYASFPNNSAGPSLGQNPTSVRERGTSIKVRSGGSRSYRRLFSRGSGIARGKHRWRSAILPVGAPVSRRFIGATVAFSF